MFALVKNDIENAPDKQTQIKVNFWDGVENRMESRLFNLSLNGCIQDASFHKMAVKKTIECLSSKRVVKGAYLDPKLVNVPGIFTKLAVGYQVLSADHTAFICVIEENRNGAYFPSQDVIVPSLESVDYQQLEHSLSSKNVAYNKMSSGVKKSCALGMPFFFGSSQKTKKGNNSLLKSLTSKIMSVFDSASYEHAQAPAPALASFKNEPQKFSRERFESYDDDNNEIKDYSRQKLDPRVEGLVNRIVMSQEIDGSWKRDNSLLNALRVSRDVLEPLKEQLAGADAIVMTLAVLAWLEAKADSSSVVMIVKKGTRFLRKKNVENYSEMISLLKNSLN